VNWIFFSCSLIIFNKWILAESGFPFPLALTMCHMAFCSCFAAAVIKSGKVEAPSMEMDTYLKAVVPIGALYSGTLWFGNSAYLFLSVSFIQMLKAMMPVLVFAVGCLLKTEKFSWGLFGNMVVVTIGVLIASYGEIEFVMFGFLLQILSLVFESTRLALVQILLQKRGLKLNPITSLYFISPACFAFLSVPFIVVEVPKMTASDDWTFRPGVLLLNCCVALALNIAVFMLIGKTSALTMNVSGVIKDWLLIGLSVVLFASPVSGLQIFGYLIAFVAVAYYNLKKIKEKQAAADAEKRKQAGGALLAQAPAGPSDSKV